MTTLCLYNCAICYVRPVASLASHILFSASFILSYFMIYKLIQRQSTLKTDQLALCCFLYPSHHHVLYTFCKQHNKNVYKNILYILQCQQLICVYSFIKLIFASIVARYHVPPRKNGQHNGYWEKPTRQRMGLGKSSLAS